MQVIGTITSLEKSIENSRVVTLGRIGDENFFSVVCINSEVVDIIDKFNVSDRVLIEFFLTKDFVRVATNVIKQYEIDLEVSFAYIRRIEAEPGKMFFEITTMDNKSLSLIAIEDAEEQLLNCNAGDVVNCGIVKRYDKVYHECVFINVVRNFVTNDVNKLD